MAKIAKTHDYVITINDEFSGELSDKQIYFLTDGLTVMALFFMIHRYSKRWPYIARGYQERLPDPVEAIGKDKQMQEFLDETDDLNQRKEFLKNICRALHLRLQNAKRKEWMECPRKK